MVDMVDMVDKLDMVDDVNMVDRIDIVNMQKTFGYLKLLVDTLLTIGSCLAQNCPH